MLSRIGYKGANLGPYMSYGPFDSTHDMHKWLEEGAGSEDPLFFTVHHLESKQRIGMVSFPEHRFQICDDWKLGTLMVFHRILSDQT